MSNQPPQPLLNLEAEFMVIRFGADADISDRQAALSAMQHYGLSLLGQNEIYKPIPPEKKQLAKDLLDLCNKLRPEVDKLLRTT